MSTGPRLVGHVRTIVTGPVVGRPATTMPWVVLGSKREPFSAAPCPDFATASAVADVFATAVSLACHAWLEAALLPRQLATLARRDAAPPVVSELGGWSGR